MPSSDDVLVLDMRLSRTGGDEDARLVLLRSGDADPRSEHDWLSPCESQAAAEIGSAAARSAFVQGRIAAKRALCALRPDLLPQQVDVRAGVFGQPVVVGAQVGDLSVSIAHCDGLVVAVAFPQGHPLGVDAEAIATADEATLRALVALQEIAPDFERREALLRAWCAKESLGKILRCGLAAPASVLALEGETRDGALWRGRFLAHTQYAFLTLRCGRHIFALAHPARTRVIFESKRLIAFFG